MVDVYKDRRSVQEGLVNLYLRLNGYFITGFIIHSAVYGRNLAEIDALAVRLPYNQEPEREVGPSPFLEITEGVTDLLICEVKSRGQALQFNEGFRESELAIAAVLRWAGLFREEEILPIARELKEGLTPRTVAPRNLVIVEGPRGVRLRALLCCPERWEKDRSQPPFLYGKETFSYVWTCLRPEVPRKACGIRYDFTAWGSQLEPLVRYFKDREWEEGHGDMNSLYEDVGL